MTDRKISLLYAEDDLEDIMLFTDAINSYNNSIKVTIANNGNDVLKKLDTEVPDIIFMDINMPLMDGLQCLKSIRDVSNWKNIPVAIVSTCNLTKSETQKIGADFYFTKPIDQGVWNDIFDQAFNEIESFRLIIGH